MPSPAWARPRCSTPALRLAFAKQTACRFLCGSTTSRTGPLSSVFEGVKAEAERQQVEYVPGDASSLWSFFKTVEFWRNDILLTPVLILDQFEELFTLQSQEAREGFLSELGYLIRGVAPPSQPKIESAASEGPPSIRVVLSLREDFLGLLEEASDHIPEILDHRYRLAPLTYEMASKAITGPAAIESTDASTRAFRLEPDVVSSILAYLDQVSFWRSQLRRAACGTLPPAVDLPAH